VALLQNFGLMFGKFNVVMVESIRRNMLLSCVITNL